MEWIVVGIFWLVCGIASFLIAQSRGATNPVTWFVVGVLLGPLGVLVAILGAMPGRARELQNLATLRDNGTISTAEFERQKVGLLASGPAAVAVPNRVNQVVYATIVIVLVAVGIYLFANS